MDSDFRRPRPINNLPANNAGVPQRPAFNGTRPVSRPVFNDVARPRSVGTPRPFVSPSTPRPVQPATAPAPSPAPQHHVQPSQRPVQQAAQSPAQRTIQTPAQAAGGPVPQQVQNHSVRNVPHVAKRFAPPVKKSKYRHDNEITKPVKLFTGLMIALSVIAIASWIFMPRVTGVKTDSFAAEFIIAGAMIALSVLVLKKFNCARSIFMGLSIAMLIFSVFITLDYFNTLHSLNVEGQKDIANFQSQIGQYQSMSNLTGSEKLGITTALVSYQQRVKDGLVKDKTSLVPVFEDYVLAVVPIIFLSRKKVREVLLPIKNEVRQAGYNSIERKIGHAASANSIIMQRAPAYVDPKLA
jgi:hypothetical protein